MAPGFNPAPIMLIFIISVVGYVFPSIVAYIFKHRYLTRVILANVFLGWTVVGWFACLIYLVWSSPEEPTGEAEDRE